MNWKHGDFYHMNEKQYQLIIRERNGNHCPILIRNASMAKWLRRPPRERKIPGSNPACARIFSGSNQTSDLKIGTPVATLPGAWRYRVSAGTGRPGVSILWLVEVESLICSSYLSVAAHRLVWADSPLRYTLLLLGRKAANKQTNTQAGEKRNLPLSCTRQWHDFPLWRVVSRFVCW